MRFILFVALLGFMFFTNPTEGDHKEVLGEMVSDELSGNMEYQLANALYTGFTGTNMLDKLVDETIKVNDYYVFSISATKESNDPVAIGAFGKVVILSGVREKVKEAKL